MTWNFSEAMAQFGESEIADRPALIHDDEVITFAELRRRSFGMASWFASHGLPHQSHVGHYMRNSNAYMETFTATGLAGMGHINVNYRYLDEELLSTPSLALDRVRLEILHMGERVQEMLTRIMPAILTENGFFNNRFRRI